MLPNQLCPCSLPSSFTFAGWKGAGWKYLHRVFPTGAAPPYRAGRNPPDLPSFKVQVMFSSRRRQLWAGGGSDISLGVKWGSYFIITDYFLKLGVENTTHTWQVGWWESERWLRLLLVRGRHGHFRLQLCRCHPVPVLLELGYL